MGAGLSPPLLFGAKLPNPRNYNAFWQLALPRPLWLWEAAPWAAKRGKATGKHICYVNWITHHWET